VLELIDLFEKTTNTKVPFVWAGRRVGDVDTLVCDAQLAVRELNWHAKYDAVRMCKSRFCRHKLQRKGSVCPLLNARKRLENKTPFNRPNKHIKPIM
jgi:UDP-glucose 4-epimerase